VRDLVQFLRARLAEDEAIATAVLRNAGRGSDWWDASTLMERAQLSRAEAEHIAAHGPSRVLADVNAKRRLIDEAIDADEPGEYWNSEPRDWVLRFLAVAYAEHPDYSQAWRP
jgi:hypothetical protein